jgi:hypothetical protein
MPLSPEQEQRIRAAAIEKGLDPDRAVKLASEPLPTEGKGSAPAEIKVFQYHLPFLRVNELRAYLQLPADAPDGEQFCGEWLKVHGGILAGPTAPAKSDTPTE